MKTPTKLLIAAVAAGSLAWIALAQDDPQPPSRPQRPPRGESDFPGGPGSPRGLGGRGGFAMRPMLGPLWAALDANHDGVIDEKEIEHAVEALKKLDKNGDGKITPDEVRPVRPEGFQRPRAGRGPGGPRGRGGPGFGPNPGGPPPGDQPSPPSRPAPEE